jgi:hypothetical protein
MSNSPFPGMDPYLEGEMWQEFHDTLTHQIRGQLLASLPPHYVALLNKRYVIDRSGLEIVDLPITHVIYPDVHIVQAPRIRETAVADYTTLTAPTIELVNPLPAEVPLLNIEIRDVAERRLVTVIEILSPVNKQGSGWREYVEKRTALLQTQTHLLEIDLLRGGRRIPFIGGELPPAHYYLFLSRFTNRPLVEVWPVQLPQSLPTLPVPLLPPDPDVPLALQTAVDTAFDLVGYHRLLNYNQLPPPPLDAKTAAWVERTKLAAGQSPP